MKTGDIVYLKSGSPALTVTKLAFDGKGDSIADVEWIDDHGETVRSSFPTECLTLVDPSSPALSYANFVANKKKDGDAIRDAMTGDQADALHMAVGVAGEAGELLDAIKRWTIYQKPLDRDNVVEELGDLEFFMEGLRQRLGITRGETINGNVAKLSTRYKDRYTDAEAAGRADKADTAGLHRHGGYLHVDDSANEAEADRYFGAGDLGIKSGRSSSFDPGTTQPPR